MLKKLCVTPLGALGLLSTALAGEPYAPMAPFAGIDGKTYRAEWSDEKGNKTRDVATYELILSGRALQATHRIEGSTYGGRTIVFFDEGAQKYVYHYFTTGGFHTTGSAEMKDGVFTSVEAVNGHANVAEVIGRSTFGADAVKVEVVYVGKDGAKSPQPARLYRPIAAAGELFPD
jgi:hypothetical protein